MSDYRITCPRCDASVNIYPGYQCSCGWERPTVPLIDLATLRAEVERMRRASVCREEGWGPDEERLKAASHAVDAYTRVLDLIDKHAREGQ